jgi:hypothetical protein
VRLLPSVHRVLTLFAALLLFSAQVAICALSGAMETAWVALAQLGLYLYMDRGCSRAACVLWRPLARNGIRHPTTVCVRGVALSHVHVACFGRFSGRGCYGDSQVVQFRPLKSAGVRFFCITSTPGHYRNTASNCFDHELTIYSPPALRLAHAHAERGGTELR